MLDACTGCIPSEPIENHAEPSLAAHWQKLRGTAKPSTESPEGDCVLSLVKQEMACVMRRMEAHFLRQESLMRAIVKEHIPNNLEEQILDTCAGTSLGNPHMFRDWPVNDAEPIEKHHDEDHILIQYAREAGETDSRRMTNLMEEASWNALSCRDRLKLFLESRWFEMLAAIVILLNVAFLGIEVEITSWIPLNEIPVVIIHSNAAFTCIYAIEVALKLLAFRLEFFTNSDRGWNMFDLLIVVCSLGDFVISMVLVDDSDLVSMTQMRMLRIIRVARILRAVRMAKVLILFSSLRALILSITYTLRSMAWTVVLLTLIFYGFGVCFTQAVSDYCRTIQVDASGDPHAMPECTDHDMVMYWGSLGKSMLTLFQSISGGVNWQNCVIALEEASVMAYVLFLVYISFSYFVILNVVTGIFCNSAIECARLDKDVAIAHQLKQKSAFVRSLRKCFRDLDGDRSNVITFEEFEKALECERMTSLMDSLEIDTSDIWGLFRLIDTDGNGVIDLEELVDGCLRYKGAARATHVAKLMYDSKKQAKQITRIEKMVSRLVCYPSLNMGSS